MSDSNVYVAMSSPSNPHCKETYHQRKMTKWCQQCFENKKKKKELLETEEKKEEQREKLQECLREYIRSKTFSAESHGFGFRQQSNSQNCFQNSQHTDPQASFRGQHEGNLGKQGVHPGFAEFGSVPAQVPPQPSSNDCLEGIKDHKQQQIYEEIKKLSNLYVENYATSQLESFDAQYMEDNFEQWNWIYRINLLPESVLRALLFQWGSKQAKSNYRRLCILVHPDKTTHPLASKAFQKVLTAYQAASNYQEGIGSFSGQFGEAFSQ